MHSDQSVAIIIFSKDKTQILLTRRRDIPVWVLPGGGIEDSELPEAAAKREAEEETGCTVKLIRKIAEYIPVNNMTRYTHFFEATLLSGTPKETDETSAVGFFPLDKLPKLMPPPYPGWIADALSCPEGAILKKKIEGVNYWVLFKLMIQHPLLVGRFLLTKCGIHWNS